MTAITRRGFYVIEGADPQKLREQCARASKWSPHEEVLHLHSYRLACKDQEHVIYRNGKVEE